MLMVSVTGWSSSNGFSSSSIFSDSILEKSSTSLIKVSNASPLIWMASTYFCCSLFSGVDFNKSDIPINPFNGVLIS
ncbi:MAG: hypothetical protein BWY67_02524 [Bacteroidetes bacterium ADurb.Bin397]|nr:MAG: hypothetical protein BWY67_02524 [Bacteroidetes bacterium ADurb.Bin397]